MGSRSKGIQDYGFDLRFDISKLEPPVAKPHSPDNRALARECKDVKIDEMYTRSCTGGETEDFLSTTKVFLASELCYAVYTGVWLPQYMTDVLRQLQGNFVSLAMNRYGINVVDKCLKESTDDQISEIISKLVYSKDFLMLLQDQYGNYVALSALKVAKEKIKKAMAEPGGR